MDEKIKHLQAVSLFRAASPSELEYLARRAEEISVPSGRVLAKEGEVGHQVFIIRDGIASVKLSSGEVELGPGEFFGEMALLDQAPRVATVEAKTDMNLLVLTNRDFSSALDEVPTLARSVMRTLARRLREVEQGVRH